MNKFHNTSGYVAEDVYKRFNDFCEKKAFGRDAILVQLMVSEIDNGQLPAQSKKDLILYKHRKILNEGTTRYIMMNLRIDDYTYGYIEQVCKRLNYTKGQLIEMTMEKAITTQAINWNKKTNRWELSELDECSLQFMLIAVIALIT